jgi:tetratricopeptide (TPR) repeat protein
MDKSLLKQKAESAYKKKEYFAAAQQFLEAADLAHLESSLLEESELRNNASVAFLQCGNKQAAYEAAFQTEEVFIQAGNMKLAGMALANQACALEELARNNEALELFEKSSSILKTAGENDLRADILKHISAIKIKQGKHLEALATMDSALQNTSSLSTRDKFLKKLSKLAFKLIQR